MRSPPVRVALVGLFLICVTAAYIQNQDSPAVNRPGEDTAKQHAWLADFNAIAQRPLGHGLGTVDAVGQRFNQGGASESTLLAKGIEAGVAGLLLYPTSLFLLILYLLDLRRRAFARGDAVQVGLTVGAVGAAVAVLGAGLFLGVQEVVIEVVVWGSAGLAVAWSLSSATSIPRGSDRHRGLDGLA